MSSASTIPPEAWVAFLGVVVGSGFTLIGGWFINKSNTERMHLQMQHDKEIRREEMLRERLEELYVLSRKYLNTLVSHFLPYRDVMEGKLDFNQALDMTIEQGSEINYDPNRVDMLIDMYFERVKPEFDGVMEIRDQLNKLINGYKEQYRQGDLRGERWLEHFQPLLEDLCSRINKFENSVAELKINA